MSTVATPSREIFKIRRQTFQKKINGTTEWIVNVEAHNQNGEQYHQWRINSNYDNISNYWFLNLNGSVVDKNAWYKKCYCEVNVYINENDKLSIRKGYMNHPKFNQFNFTYLYHIGYERASNFNKEIEIFLTIASSDENDFFENLKTSLDDGTLTDTVIKTKDQEFPCHKFVLASQSEYFKKMFQTDMTESRTNSVDWSGVFDTPVVQDLLHFFYTGQKPPNIEDNHFGLLQASHLCLLQDLKGMCAESIVPIISLKNVAYVLRSADLYESGCLKREALKFVAAHSDDLQATDFYQQLEPALCKRLFKSTYEMFGNSIVKDQK